MSTPTAPHTKPNADEQEAVARELLSHNEVLSLRATWPLIPVIAVFAAIAWPRAPHALIWAWSLVNLLALLVRHQAWRWLPADRMSPAERLRKAQWLPLIPGLANASAVVFFPYLTDLGRAIVTLILAGLTTGGINSSAGYMPLYLAYMGPVMTALMLGWAITPPMDGSDTWLSKAMVPMLLMYALTMIGLARGNHRTFRLGVIKRIQEVRLNHQLRQALQQAEQANSAKTRFLASASHDLRQPLHSLSLFFATLRLQVKQPDNVQLLGHIDQALSALQSQMNTLLDMSRLDAGMVKLHWQNFRLNTLMTQLESTCRPLAQQRGLSLDVDCAPDVAVHSDFEQLSRVLRNLLDNAIKYTSSGYVQVRAHVQGNEVVVTVQDTGCGIAPAHQHQVFDEFFQVDNPERDRGRGLGLGLSIVRRLAALLYLDLALQSNVGEGTTLTVRVPVGRLTEAAAATNALPDALPSMPMCHVLVLDDEATVRIGMQALLKRMGCEVSLAGSTQEALDMAAACAPDLVLADLRLRGQENGIHAVQQLRELQPRLPAIIVTGDTAPDRLKQAQAAGMTTLHKPVATEALIAAMAQALEGSS
jgi:signal transduction histidine kinase/CheY-like chemotaxis protein